MILNEFIEIKINTKNYKILKELGYFFEKCDEIIYIKTIDLSKGSHQIIDVKCDVCDNERKISYKEYLRSCKIRGYYSCKGKCSTGKIKETNLQKYGVDFYSKTNESKEKCKNTNLNKYGVDYPSKLDTFKQNVKITILERYGVENISSSEFHKEKRKNTMLKRHGVEYYVLSDDFKKKSELTSLKNYGFIHHLMNKNQMIKMFLSTGRDFETNEYKTYRVKVDKLTRYNKKELLNNWDGYDFYDKTYIKENYKEFHYLHGNYPTIDHKISVFQGFKEGISPHIIADINNLCITKRFINSKKHNKSNFTL
jgi:hypothetical protein